MITPAMTTPATTRTLSYLSVTDRHGRCRYLVTWWADYHPGDPDGEYRHAQRGQISFGIPPDTISSVPLADVSIWRNPTNDNHSLVPAP